jgi:hypothetical protein
MFLKELTPPDVASDGVEMMCVCSRPARKISSIELAATLQEYDRFRRSWNEKETDPRSALPGSRFEGRVYGFSRSRCRGRRLFVVLPDGRNIELRVRGTWEPFDDGFHNFHRNPLNREDVRAAYVHEPGGCRHVS